MSADIRGMRHLAFTAVLFLTIVGITISNASDSQSEKHDIGKAHKELACAKCHTLQSNQTSFASAKGRIELCVECHDRSDKGEAGWSDIFHNDRKRPCSDCHSFHNPTTIKTEDKQFSLSDQDMTAFICQTCHIPGQELAFVSEGHRRAATQYYHSDQGLTYDESPSETCLNCHSEHGSYLVDSESRGISINVSASHTFGVNMPQTPDMKSRSEIDQQIRLLDDKIECQSCHSLSSGKKDALVDYDNPYDLCLGCHALKG